ncbi:MAG: diaminopimelate epimerase [Bacteroidales bacterium]|nr:diaminopimelate epimerase [Bacteroidales bacterium]
MTISFYKYQGAGNDFVIIDNTANTISLNTKQIELLCNRRFGIGADGLMLLEKHSTMDFNMRYFNSDGNEGTMCGNGGRCLVAMARRLNVISEKTSFNSIDGVHNAIINDDNTVSLQMQDVSSIDVVDENYFLDTGSPHYVAFCNDVKNVDVFNKGKEIRYSEKFRAEGTNVNFVEILNEKKLFVRTYERGVENETLSCGTGVTASAISAAIHINSDKKSFDIETLGGNLNVRFNQKSNNTFEDIWLTGPAEFVFEGKIEI